MDTDMQKQNEQLLSDIQETARQLEITTVELARLRALLSEISDEFLSGIPCETHGDWCLTHSTNHCRADELRAKVKAEADDAIDPARLLSTLDISIEICYLLSPSTAPSTAS